MARLEKAKGSKTPQNSGYTRVLGITKLGALMSKVQSTVITAGTELEKLIWENSPTRIEDLDDFLRGGSSPKGVWVASKEVAIASAVLKLENRPDFLVFEHKNGYKRCYVLELKDGYEFDTKKAIGEKRILEEVAENIRTRTDYTVGIKMCGFNCADRSEIVTGFKGEFKKDETFTGKEFCELIGADFEDIKRIRAADQRANLEFFVKSLLDIVPVKNMIRKMLQGK